MDPPAYVDATVALQAAQAEAPLADLPAVDPVALDQAALAALAPAVQVAASHGICRSCVPSPPCRSIGPYLPLAAVGPITAGLPIKAGARPVARMAPIAGRITAVRLGTSADPLPGLPTAAVGTSCPITDVLPLADRSRILLRTSTDPSLRAG